MASTNPTPAMISTTIILALLAFLIATEPDTSRDDAEL
jgi:hypothetical protein